MKKVVIIGGLGYLGINLAFYHHKKGDEVTIVTRLSSIARRRAMSRLLNYLSIDILALNNLSKPSALETIKSVDPDVAYITLGKLSGSSTQIFESNTYLPIKIMSYLTKYVKNCLNIYISHAFNYRSLKKHITVINDKPFTVYYDINQPSRPLDAIINKDYFLSKFFAESLIEKILGYNTVIYRPGLIIGLIPPHREWKLLNALSQSRLYPPILNRIPVTLAIDIAKITDHIFARNTSEFRFLLTTMYSPTILELSRAIGSAFRKDRAAHYLGGTYSNIGLEILAPLLLRSNELLYPYTLNNLLGFKGWTPLHIGIRLMTTSLDINKLFC